MLFISYGSIAGSGKKTKVQGTILSYDKETLAGAKIEVEGTEIVVYSDFEGHFNIGQLTPGTYNLTVTLISYQELEVKLLVNGANSYRLQLDPR